MRKILVTGGVGFIGSTVIRHIIKNAQDSVVSLGRLAYTGNLESLADMADNPCHAFEQVDICGHAGLDRVFAQHRPDTIIHLAAESYVDRSIDSTGELIQAGVVGTFNLLEAARTYWQRMPFEKREAFHFHHTSTDKVYGDLHGTDDLSTETTPCIPSSPYSASEASNDHLVRAWLRTYGLPTIVVNCSNNYGPHHSPKRLTPLTILNTFDGKPLPIYGGGVQTRDWLLVEDHARVLYQVVTEGVGDETYNIDGHNEKANIGVVKAICALLEELIPERPTGMTRYEDLITFVQDHPGHDVRYAIDATKIGRELGWKPQETFESGIRKTVQWCLNNKIWW